MQQMHVVKAPQLSMPHSIEAEEGVLGSLLVGFEEIVLIADLLLPEHFYRSIHQIIYAEMLSLWQSRLPADYITLCEALARADKLELVGGRAYISDLANAMPTSSRLVYYAEIVRRKWMHRELIKGAGELASAGYHEDTDALDRAEQLVYALRKGVTVAKAVTHREAMNGYMEKLQELFDQRREMGQVFLLSGLDTGYPMLNRLLGGLRKKKYYVIAARPGQGKTALMLNMIYEAVKNGLHVIMFSLEMDVDELMQRWLARVAKVGAEKLRDMSLTDEEWARVIEAHATISCLPGTLWIDDASSKTHAAMRAYALQVQAQHGLDALYVDYLQIASADPSSKQNDRRLVVEEISRELKNIARDLDIPVIAAAQINRDSAGGEKPPELHHLREAGGIEQDADSVLMIHKDPQTALNATSYGVDLLVRKNRGGGTGSVPLWFVGAETSFYSQEARDV